MKKYKNNNINKGSVKKKKTRLNYTLFVRPRPQHVIGKVVEIVVNVGEVEGRFQSRAGLRTDHQASGGFVYWEPGEVKYVYISIYTVHVWNTKYSIQKIRCMYSYSNEK